MIEDIYDEYSKQKEWVLDKVYFNYHGKHFVGRGVLRWNTKDGFFLESPLEQSREFDEPILFKNRLIVKDDRTSIRMLIKDGGIAFAPSVTLVNRHDIIDEGRISISLFRVIFFTHYRTSVGDGNFWLGNALYGISSMNRFLDRVKVKQEISVGGDYSTGGFVSHFKGVLIQDDEGAEVVGYAIDKNHMFFQWKLPKDKFSKMESSRYAESIQYSLSIVTGESVRFLRSELFYGMQRRVFLQNSAPVKSLNDFSLLPQQLLHKFPIKQAFFQLTKDFSLRNDLSVVCKNIFLQVADAAKQDRLPVSEFLIATTLEAALRNLDKKPFVRKKNKSKKEWEIKRSLTTFLQQYFPRHDTEDLKNQIMGAHVLLRDRNAHPDWLFAQGGSLSEEELEKSFDSMIFLTRFYGYMILALSGCEDFELVFPKPISQWGAFLTIHSAHPHDEVLEEEI
jgi:hypothetical protein